MGNEKQEVGNGKKMSPQGHRSHRNYDQIIIQYNTINNLDLPHAESENIQLLLYPIFLKTSPVNKQSL